MFLFHHVTGYAMGKSMAGSQLTLPMNPWQDIIMRTSPVLPAPPSSGERLRTGHRLFVPLATEPFRWFCSGRKKWELRKKGRQYTPKHVRPGRDVELRRGYTDRDTALWGEIIDVIEADSVEAFFLSVPWHTVLPECNSLGEAILNAYRILNIADGKATPVLGFKVALARP